MAEWRIDNGKSEARLRAILRVGPLSRPSCHFEFSLRAAAAAAREFTYVFPHIPKCGGTSLLKTFEESDLKTFIDYDAFSGPAMHRRNAEAGALDFSAFNLIYGHFPIGRYTGNSRYRYITLVRDPIDRNLSAFAYSKWRWENGYMQSNHPAAERARKMVSGEMDFLEYLRTHSDNRRVYKHFLGHWDRSRFELIGSFERYAAFVDALSDLLGVNFPNDRHERKAEERAEISASERAEARKILAEEYDWYDEFVLGAV